MSKTGMLCTLQKIRSASSFQRSFTVARIVYNKPGSSETTGSGPNVPGLSKNCVVITEPVGPGAAKNSGYKNPEYFCYNINSYYEAEVEMLKYRCPQPSASTKK